MNIIDKNIPIEAILLGNFIKYNSMQKLTISAFEGSDANTLNVYVDLYQMFLNIYRGTTIENYSIITSTVINLCAHIRAYYRTRHQVETKIFLVYSNNDSSANSLYCYEYNKTYKDRIAANPQIHDVVLSNLKLLDILCPYLPDIFFIKGSVEPGVIIYDLICKMEALGDTSPSIIYSKSLYNYQIPAFNMNSVIFRQKKVNGEDCSRMVNNKNAIHEYITETRAKYYENELNTQLLSLLIVLTNLPTRNIPTLFNIRMAIDLLTKAIQHNLIVNGYNSDIEYVFTRLNEIKKMPIELQMFANRFKCVDLVYQHMLYMNTPDSKDTSYLLNLNDPNTVRGINNEYFKSNPLDLNRL